MKQFKLDESRKEILLERLKSLRLQLDADKISDPALNNIVIDLVFVLEQAVKILIADVNLLLIYKKIPEAGIVARILDQKSVGGVHTIWLRDAIPYLLQLCPESKISKNNDIALLLLDHRSEVYHHIAAIDGIMPSDLMGLTRTIYEAISADLEPHIGNLPAPKRPPKTFTKAEVDKLLEDSVRRKIDAGKYRDQYEIFRGADAWHTYGLDTDTTDPYSWSFSQVCPRCQSRSFKLITPDFMQPMYTSAAVSIFDQKEQYYQCGNCHLELTPQDFEIAKRIRMKRVN